MILCGIDPSYSSTGIVIYDDKKDKYKYYGFSKKKKKMKNIINYDYTEDRFEQYKFILDNVEKILKDNKVEKAYIEGYSFGSTGDALIKLFGYCEQLRMLLIKLDIEYTEIPPTTIKKFATGYGGKSSDKNIMGRFFYDEAPDDFEFKEEMWSSKKNIVAPYHDIIDAYWVLKTGISKK